ncbi:MAG: hypothetical protein GWP08_16140 [Nitrospiraceae bacterium]|nr:hypothetical protein [Nitrospiraceae bacterium]
MKKLVLLVMCALAAGCVTGSARNRAAADKPSGPVSLTDPRPAVTLEWTSSQTLGDVMHRVGQEVGGSLVLMSKMENRVVRPLKFRGTPYGDFVRGLAEAAGCMVQETEHYYFVYPEEYGALTSVSVTEKLRAEQAGMTIAMAFGFDTPMFETLVLLGDTLGYTIVADNVIADTTCGPLTLAQAPLGDALDTLLKSARIPPGAFEIETGAGYVFLRGPHNPAPADTRLGDGSGEADALLAKRVDVTLPSSMRANGRMEVPPGAAKLRDVLADLSLQLEISVLADKGLGELPVNPVVFRDVPVSTVMDLLIRQWPVAKFGYEVRDGRIVIVRRPAAGQS